MSWSGSPDAEGQRRRACSAGLTGKEVEKSARLRKPTCRSRWTVWQRKPVPSPLAVGRESQSGRVCVASGKVASVECPRPLSVPPCWRSYHARILVRDHDIATTHPR